MAQQEKATTSQASQATREHQAQLSHFTQKLVYRGGQLINSDSLFLTPKFPIMPFLTAAPAAA